MERIEINCTTGAVSAVTMTAEEVAAMQPTLDQSKADQIGQIETAYQEANSQLIAYMATMFQADKDSQDLIALVLTASGGTLPAGFAWYDENNAAVEMTFTQLQGLAAAILTRGQPLFVKKQTLKAQIRSATTIATVEAIVW